MQLPGTVDTQRRRRRVEVPWYIEATAGDESVGVPDTGASAAGPPSSTPTDAHDRRGDDDGDEACDATASGREQRRASPVAVEEEPCAQVESKDLPFSPQEGEVDHLSIRMQPQVASPSGFVPTLRSMRRKARAHFGRGAAGRSGGRAQRRVSNPNPNPDDGAGADEVAQSGPSPPRRMKAARTARAVDAEDEADTRAVAPSFTAIAESEGAMVRLTADGGTQYVIPAWDQFVVEYLFPEAFEDDIDYAEFFALAMQFGTMLLNIVMVGINVFSNDIDNPSYTIRVLSFAVFIAELAVVWLSFLLFIVVALDGLCQASVGTNYVVDLVDLSTFTGAFSAFKVIAYASPSRMIKMLGARWQTAYGCCDYLAIVGLIFWWLIGFAFATAVLVLKVTQVDFAFNKELPDWTWMEFIQLFGLANNLSGIDLSYSALTGALFDALHNHYCGPGGPISPSTSREGLFTRMKKGLGLENASRSYEFIECIFDYNFKFSRSTSLEKAAHSFNFMSFLLRLDATKLRQLLQMTRSPLDYYSSERRQFDKALKADDEEGMLDALRRADPLSREVSGVGKGHKLLPRFHLYYTCEASDVLLSPQRLNEAHSDPKAVPSSPPLEKVRDVKQNK